MWQRPQHLLSRAIRDFDVVFFEEPIIGDIARARLSVSTRRAGLRVAVPHLPRGLQDVAITMALEELAKSLLEENCGRAVLLWYYTPMAMPFSDILDRDVTLYDNMDELSAFRGASPELLVQEEALLRRADVMFTGGISLYEAKQGRHPNIHAFPSSIDVAHFSRTRELQDAVRLDERVTVGFFGVIDERLDIDLLAALADLRPDWRIEMVGPVVKIDPVSLPQRPNIQWSGPCPYADLPERLATWRVGIMPFALNEATRFISPTKTPEFLAAGMPVVSTAIVDVVRSYGQLGLVEIAATAPLFAEAIERLLDRPREPWLQGVDRHLATMSWDATWDAMQVLIAEAMVPGRSAATAPTKAARHRLPSQAAAPIAVGETI